MNEYCASESVYELADMIEVIKAILNAENISWHDLESRMQTKMNERGGFGLRFVLERVEIL